MSRYRGSNSEGKLYIGDLPPDASEKELERAFSYYGHLRNVWVARNPPGFAFVEFEDYRDAEDAIRGMDGTLMYRMHTDERMMTKSAGVKHYCWPQVMSAWSKVAGLICGVRARVELSSGRVRPKPWLRGARGAPRARRAFHQEDRCYECGERGHYAYDCHKYGRGRRSRRSKSRSVNRSRSRSRSRRTRSPTHSKSHSRSRSPVERSRSRSQSRSRGRRSPEAAPESDEN